MTFDEWMTEKYGGVIVAPKGGFQVDDLYDAWLAGRGAETDYLGRGAETDYLGRGGSFK